MWTAAFADPWSLIITESERGRESEVEKTMIVERKSEKQTTFIVMKAVLISMFSSNFY